MDDRHNKNHYHRVNTFSRTPSPAQIASYIVIAFETVVFYVMVGPSTKVLSPTIATVFTVLYSVALGMVCISTFVCSYMDPSDPVMIQYKNNRHLPINQLQDKLSKSLQELLYCEYCMSYVQNSARHCRACDRCVENFDHHCMWINNCIGNRNYRVFMAMILSTFCNLAIFIAAVIYLSVAYAMQHGTILLGFMVTSWVVLAIVAVLCILLFNLILLHVYLICKGYTTYQFIVARREAERREQLEKANEEARKRQRKIRQKYDRAAINNSNHNNKQVLPPPASPKKKMENSNKREFIVMDQNVMKSVQHEEEYSYTNTNHKFIQTPPEHKNKYESEVHNPDSEETLAKINADHRTGQKFYANQSKGAGRFRQSIADDDVIFNGQELAQSKSEGSDNFGQKFQDVAISKKDPSEDQSRGKQLTYNESANGNRENQMMLGEHAQRFSTNEQIQDEQDHQEIRISQFFTRNKSLSFLLSDDRAHKPHKKTNNISMVVRGTGETESIDDPKSHLPRTGKSKTKISAKESLPVDPIKQFQKKRSAPHSESRQISNSIKHLRKR